MTTSVGQVLQMDMQMIQEMHCPIPHIYEVNRFKQLTAFFWTISAFENQKRRLTTAQRVVYFSNWVQEEIMLMSQHKRAVTQSLSAV